MTGIEEKKFEVLDISGERVNTFYHEAGTNNKEDLIFAQTGGAGTSAYMCWYPNLTTFAEAGYHVYAPDFVGYTEGKRRGWQNQYLGIHLILHGCPPDR